MQAWVERVTDELLRLRVAGVRSFDVAWMYAMDAFPPRGMLLGPAQMSLDDEESVVDFLRRRARLEWDGLVVDDFRAGLSRLVA